MAKLNQAQIDTSHAWLYDIFSMNGITGGQQNVRPTWYYNYEWSHVKNEAKTIYDAIKFRKVNYQNFVDIDNALDRLSRVHFTPTIRGSQNTRATKKNANMLANYVANFCAEKGIYWDDTLATPFERDEIKKTTIGGALWDYNCFVTQANATKATSNQGTSTRVSTPRTPGQAPQNGYKSLGGLSGNVSTLVGQPGQKTTPNVSVMYCIEADKLGKNTPCIFVTPVSSAGTSVDKMKAANVNIGSGNGYSDCKLWWDDLNDAQVFLNSCLNKFANGKFQNIHIAKARPDANGYFEVSTEFGNAYIKASRLNEEITEWLNFDMEEALAEACQLEADDLPIEEDCDLEEAKKKKQQNKSNKSKKAKTTSAYKIKDIGVYSSAFDKYRD